MIKLIKKLSDAHGKAEFETCDCCGRKVRQVAYLDNDQVVGLQCGITLSVMNLTAEEFSAASDRLGVSVIANMIGAEGYNPMVKKSIAIRSAK